MREIILTPEHPAGPATAAFDLARMILQRVPNWTVTIHGDAWTTTDPDDDYTRHVTIDATKNQHHEPVDPRTARAWRRGPLVIAVAHDMEIRLQLPEMVDRTDLRRVVTAATAIGALPDEHGMTH